MREISSQAVDVLALFWGLTDATGQPPCANKHLLHPMLPLVPSFRELGPALDLLLAIRERVSRDQLVKCIIHVLNQQTFELDNITEPAHRLAREICCLLYTSPSPRDATLSRMPSSA